MTLSTSSERVFQHERALALARETFDTEALAIPRLKDRVTSVFARVVQAMAVEAASLMEPNRITSVLIVDADGRLRGALNSNDLMRAKVT